MKSFPKASRRAFLTSMAAVPAIMMGPEISGAATDDGISILGPKPGYTPQLGTLVSMLTWMQPAVIGPVKGLTQAQLDYLFDTNANSIGALLLHLAATERFYQLHTFDGMKWGDFPKEEQERWGAAMELGDAGRKTIKGHDLKFYTDAMTEVRERSLAEFKKRDDTWLMTVDKTWPWGPTNNYCKWFHVCEHESHHAGQIDLLLKRVPGARA